MEISILLTLLLIIILPWGSFLQAGRIYLINKEQINDSITIKHNHKEALYSWAVKLVMREDYLLNTITISDVQKTTQTTLIQAQIHKFEG
ncbi:hypothetical protein [Falsiporphyromonas endometrii]|uniref:ATP synthase F0 subunit 8 n=1 Tax=Falsiporphyromonas endometrii TaxID=1387297 RepID=A0ABV9K802_9PORP